MLNTTTNATAFEHQFTEAELEQFVQDGLMSQREVDARYLAGLNRQKAKELLDAMRKAVDKVPAYISKGLPSYRERIAKD